MGEGNYAIEVRDLVKEFRVHHRTYGSVKSHTAAIVRSLIMGRREGGYDIRRALDGVSFNVARGEAVAIIGKNGSGKSTLLSILSRVYLPTSGVARLHGRVVGLLELGAGFHAELTGIENLYFNGAVFGMSDKRITELYQSIVAFSGLDSQAMELPVRMYSSGMQIRLAFALAAHLEEEVLLVDEGLAVGDVAFQEKCFKRMDDFKREGRTILLVTHSPMQVERIADRVIWLDQGRIKMEGAPAEVMAEYKKVMNPTAPSNPAPKPAAAG